MVMVLGGILIIAGAVMAFAIGDGVWASIDLTMVGYVVLGLGWLVLFYGFAINRYNAYQKDKRDRQSMGRPYDGRPPM